jgi:hypothetical protein
MIFPRERVATLAVLAAVGLATAPARAEQPRTPSLKTHGPIEVRRLEDGSLARGPRNEFVTSNWSGYAIGSYQTGHKYTSAQGTWVVPTVTFGSTNSGTNEEYSATRHQWQGRYGGGAKPLPRENIVSLGKAVSARQIRERIGQQLKEQYRDLAEPIPERLAELVKQLAQRMDERARGTG